MPSGTETDTLYSRADNAAVCVSHNGWLERAMTAANENACQNAESLPVPPIPRPIVISPLPINAAIASFIGTLRANYSGACSDIGPMNWAIAVRFLFYYKTTVRKRKSMIKELRANLNASVKDFRDLNTQSVYEGALKTFLNNLTAANREHYQMEMFMSTTFKVGDHVRWNSEAASPRR